MNIYRKHLPKRSVFAFQMKITSKAFKYSSIHLAHRLISNLKYVSLTREDCGGKMMETFP